MEHFNLQRHIDHIYQQYPATPRRPLIGLTANFTDGDASLRDRYYDQVVKAGGTPVLIPPIAHREVLADTVAMLDGLLLTGGADINPLWTGEEPSPNLHHINATRDLPELLITQLAFNRQIPILGICRGIQTLAAALGGHIAQDINETLATTSPSRSPLTVFSSSRSTRAAQVAARQLPVKHAQEADRDQPTHSVYIEPHSMLHEVYEADRILVNSFHHQAVAQPGNRFRVVAKAPDGVIEAIESSEFKPILGVQWHPEWLEEEGLKLFKWLVTQAGNFHVAKQLHRRVLTLDTHCDTPMFFHQGIHFNQRDPRIKVDLHKMEEGHQDSVTMVAFLPQPKLGQSFSQNVKLPVKPAADTPVNLTPTSYADLIFNEIEDIVKRHSSYISIARTPADLYEDKRKGRKSIMFGIENGLALGHDLQNVRHFAQRGVIYITLCHNGDNDICDSARGCNTNGGLTKFGEQVIQEMNNCGIMVDLSHAAETSFYDALRVSRHPIVCSHSNCRALCDHPRNLTDDQLRALADKGGLCHITLYDGFLRKDGEATIMDALAHLEHAISVMGIEHVGLGTDFDGDGGIRGLSDSSELINFTRHLLRRKYSERDIEKIWGGNWIRLMARVQSQRR